MDRPALLERHFGGTKVTTPKRNNRQRASKRLVPQKFVVQRFARSCDADRRQGQKTKQKRTAFWALQDCTDGGTFHRHSTGDGRKLEWFPGGRGGWAGLFFLPGRTCLDTQALRCRAAIKSRDLKSQSDSEIATKLLLLKTILTTPTPHINKKHVPKYARNCGVVQHKNPLK